MQIVMEKKVLALRIKKKRFFRRVLKIENNIVLFKFDFKVVH